MSGLSVITDKTVDAVLDALEKKGYEQTDLVKPRPEEAVIALNYRQYRVRFTVRVADAADPEQEEEHRCTCPTCTCNHGGA
jgi:hypothetical protein